MRQDMPKDDGKGLSNNITTGDCFIDPLARIVGHVLMGEGCSLWPGVVVKGDDTRLGKDVILMPGVKVEEGTNIGDRVFIAPGARLEQCTIGGDTFVGMDTVICKDAEVGKGSVITDGTIIREGTVIPERSLVKGTPGTVEGRVTDETLRKITEVRSQLDWRKEEFKIMLKRGELFGVNELPGRPEDMWSEYRDTGDSSVVEREAKFLKLFGIDI